MRLEITSEVIRVEKGREKVDAAWYVVNYAC
jgi:hypothetical protein